MPSEHFCIECPSLDYTARIFPVEETDTCELVLLYSVSNKCILKQFASDETYMYVAEMDVSAAFRILSRGARKISNFEPLEITSGAFLDTKFSS